MRAFTMLLAVLLLQGCLATASLQQENTEAVRQTAQQCSDTLARMDDLISAHDKTTKALERESRARKASAKAIAQDQACLDLRRSISNKTIVGAVEWATVDLGGHLLTTKARMDTGASTSSIGARNITEFERNGKRWVRFTLADGNEVSLPQERFATIRQASSEKDRRRVVKLGIRVGQISQVVEFTLKDRSHLNYEVLIGRNLLRDLMVVDVARRYVVGGDAKHPPKSLSSGGNKKKK